MSIENTLTLLLAMGILVGALAIGAAFHGAAKLFVAVRGSIRPNRTHPSAPRTAGWFQTS